MLSLTSCFLRVVLAFHDIFGLRKIFGTSKLPAILLIVLFAVEFRNSSLTEFFPISFDAPLSLRGRSSYASPIALSHGLMDFTDAL